MFFFPAIYIAILKKIQQKMTSLKLERIVLEYFGDYLGEKWEGAWGSRYAAT